MVLCTMVFLHAIVLGWRLSTLQVCSSCTFHKMGRIRVLRTTIFSHQIHVSALGSTQLYCQIESDISVTGRNQISLILLDLRDTQSTTLLLSWLNSMAKKL